MPIDSDPHDNLGIIDLLRRIKRLDDFSDRDLLALVKLGKFRQYEPGEIIIREGDFDSWVYLLITGTLEIVKAGKIVGALRRNGDFFGEMGVIDGSARSATVRAGSRSFVLGFDAAVIDHKIKTREIYFCYLIFRLFSEVLAARLRNTTTTNIQLQKELDAHKRQVEDLRKELAGLSPGEDKPGSSSRPPRRPAPPPARKAAAAPADS